MVKSCGVVVVGGGNTKNYKKVPKNTKKVLKSTKKYR